MKKTKTGFKVPDRATREKAASIQKAHGNPKLRNLLAMTETHLCDEEGGQDKLFRPIHQPEPGDWLADVKEKGQTAAAYSEILTRATKKKMYVQPLGTFVPGKSPSLSTLQEFASVYMSMDVEVLAPIQLKEAGEDYLVAILNGEDRVKTSDTDRTWQCDSCTALNNHNTSRCGQCEKARPAFRGTLDTERRKTLNEHEDTPKSEVKNQTEKIARVAATGEPLKIRWRFRFGRRQLLTQNIEAFMKMIKPKDAYCIVAVVMEDLYPKDEWRHVVGEADMNSKVGVFSFARFSPHFNVAPSQEGEKPLNTTGVLYDDGEGKGKEESKEKEEETEKEKESEEKELREGEEEDEDESHYPAILKRSCKVMAHETLHIFGIEHCIYYKCNMNGARGKNDGKPIHLCPVDLHKLYCFQHKTLKNSSFDIEERYRKLYKFYSENKGFEIEAAWVEKMLDTCFNGSSSVSTTPSITEKEDQLPRSEERGKAAIRVNVCKKGTASKKPIVVGDWDELISSGTTKLNMKKGNNNNKKKKITLWNAKGEPITSFSHVQEDAVIYFS